MKGVISVALVVGLMVGCGQKSAPTPDFIPDPQGWFIESYDQGLITVQHQGNVYKATCDSSRTFNITDKNNNVIESSTCNLVIDHVGHNVQPEDGKQRDANGNIVTMWNVGAVLALRSVNNEHAPWRQEEFKITSVKPKS
jgi:hypothetical protein